MQHLLQPKVTAFCTCFCWSTCCAVLLHSRYFGFYSARYQGYNAVLGTLGGLVAGLLVFPAPSAPTTYLLESFLLATLVPVIISLILLMLPVRRHFDFLLLTQTVRSLKG